VASTAAIASGSSEWEDPSVDLLTSSAQNLDLDYDGGMLLFLSMCVRPFT
jgi:hypothetical protein